MPSTRAIPDRDVFYVADPASSIRDAIDPIGNVALFAGLTASLTRAERHLTALRAVIYATIILVAAMTAGQIIDL